MSSAIVFFWLFHTIFLEIFIIQGKFLQCCLIMFNFFYWHNLIQFINHTAFGEHGAKIEIFHDIRAWTKDISSRMDIVLIELMPNPKDSKRVQDIKQSARLRMEALSNELHQDEMLGNKDKFPYSFARLKAFEARLDSIGSTAFGIYWTTSQCFVKDSKVPVKCGSIEKDKVKWQ